MDSGEREARLVLLAQSGDRRALDELFRAVQRPLYRCLTGIMGDPGLAEDALQEVFVIIYRKLRWLREPTVFRAWAYRIATRQALRTLKRERKWREQVRDEAVMIAAAGQVGRQAEDRELLDRLPRLVATVSPARAVLVLHYLEGLGLKDVAAVLGLSLGTVKSRLAYGLATLRRNVVAEGGHGS